MSSHVFELPSFEIEGNTYTFKRLGTRTTQHLSTLLKNAWKNGVIDLNVHLEQMKFLSEDPSKFNPEVSAELMAFFSVDHCLDSFLELMSLYLLKVNEDKTKSPVAEADLENEELFPMYSLVTMAAFFTSHPDLSMFISAINEGKDLPFFQNILQKLRESLKTQTET